jgi:hypothetical protein
VGFGSTSPRTCNSKLCSAFHVDDGTQACGAHQLLWRGCPCASPASCAGMVAPVLAASGPECINVDSTEPAASSPGRMRGLPLALLLAATVACFAMGARGFEPAGTSRPLRTEPIGEVGSSPVPSPASPLAQLVNEDGTLNTSIFDILDTDHDGQLSREEFEIFQKAIGSGSVMVRRSLPRLARSAQGCFAEGRISHQCSLWVLRSHPALLRHDCGDRNRRQDLLPRRHPGHAPRTIDSIPRCNWRLGVDARALRGDRVRPPSAAPAGVHALCRGRNGTCWSCCWMDRLAI